MINGDVVSSEIRSFIIQKFPGARKRTVSDVTPLLESGIIDSLGILDVVTYLEHSFQIQVVDEDLVPENFATIQSIAFFVEQKRHPLRVSAD
jgi:acyl carrier protein